jgi:ubiquinone/menaquinone biosynthesis C-methylase UbiE
MTKQRWDEVALRSRKGYYPSAPSKEEIKMFEQFFKKIVKPDSKVLILGATPSLRDIGLKYGCEVTAVDINRKMIKKMSDYMKYKNHPKEITIESDWLDMPVKDKYHHIIMGDFSLNNIKPKDHHEMMEKLKKVLKDDGFILMRHRVHNPESRLYSYKEVVNMFRKGRIAWRDLKYLTVLQSKDLPKIYNPKTRLFYWERYFSLLKKSYLRKELTKKEFDSIYQERMKVISTIYSKDDFEKLFKKYFNILKKDYCKKYISSKSAIFYIARPK